MGPVCLLAVRLQRVKLLSVSVGGVNTSFGIGIQCFDAINKTFWDTV